MDPNVFALIFPRDANNATEAFASKENRHFYVPATTNELDRNSRESTPDVCTRGKEDRRDNERLELHFNGDPPLKDPTEGWQFGYSAQASDVMICRPRTVGVSRRHFAISITPDFRIQFHQKTTQMTRVVLCSKTGRPHEIQPRQGDIFFVCLAPSESQYWSSIEVIVADKSQGAHFEIIFPNHTSDATQEYCDHLRQWVQNRASAVPPVTGLGLQSTASTVAPSRQSHTPPRFSSLCYQRVIGSGAFGEVELLVDLPTGDTAARKRFFKLLTGADNQNAVKERRSVMKTIRNEVRLMQQNPHPNIIQLLAFQEHPVPSILMPYYPHGNIANISMRPEQYRSAFRQLLIVLDYLHGRNVAHRDLKPENILVDSVEPIRIVVSDFGLSKEAVPGELMKTFCGTRLYGAPDIFPSHQWSQSMQGYWVSVDVWSAGVIMLEWTYGRPDTGGMYRQPPNEWVSFWSQTLLEVVRKLDQENPDDTVMDILKHMLDPDPQTRYQARECLLQGCANGLFKRTRSGDVIDAKDDRTDGAGAKTPKPTTTHGARPLNNDERLAHVTISTEIATLRPEEICALLADESWASAAEKQESSTGSGGRDSAGQALAWKRFMNFDLLPACDQARVDEASYTSEEFVSAVEEMPPEHPAPLTVKQVEEETPAKLPATTGAKRRRHPDTSTTSTTSSSSTKGDAPRKKKRPINVGYNSAVWSDVLGSQPRLARVSPQTSSVLPSSMSLIDYAHELAPSQAPTITSSMSLLEGASNFSTRAA